MRLSALVAASAVLAFAAPAAGHHKSGHQIPPGQMNKIYDPEIFIPVEIEHVCLVTTAISGDPYAPVVFTEWLPRPEAEAEANEGDSFVIFHPSVNTEDGCIGF